MSILNGLLPHGICFAGRPDLVWLHVASDALIALAYFVIPLTLIYFLRRHRTVISFNWAIALFAAFIVLCGTGHVLALITVWQPIYYVQGWVKALTAVVSVATAVSIIPLVPRLLAMRSPEELEEANAKLAEANRQLAEANAQLKLEIEARLAAEADVHASLAEARRSAAELEQFAYIASHDLQAPLRNISGFAQLLEKRHAAGLKDDAREFLNFIHAGIQQMQSLISDLLQLSRVGRAKDSTVQTQPLRSTVDRALAALATEISQSKAEITVQALPTVATEHRLLTQLLQNLISNSLKFQQAGNVPQIEIAAEEQPQHWRISIRDNGIGIPADQLEKVFEIFRRLHTQDEYDGSGIGLAICRKIATHLDGTLTAHSDGPGQGTTFFLTLPKQGPRPAVAVESELAI